MYSAYTNYPFEELGDPPKIAVMPPRLVEVVSYDGDKYAVVKYLGVEVSVEAGYLYEEDECIDQVKIDWTIVPRTKF